MEVFFLTHLYTTVPQKFFNQTNHRFQFLQAQVPQLYQIATLRGQKRIVSMIRMQKPFYKVVRQTVIQVTLQVVSLIRHWFRIQIIIGLYQLFSFHKEEMICLFSQVAPQMAQSVINIIGIILVLLD